MSKRAAPPKNLASRLRALSPLVLCTAYVVLLAAWALANPPFAAPDEWAHYVRAIGVGGGELIGARASYEVPPDAPDEVKRQYAWINQAARAVEVPPGLYVPGLDCNAAKPSVSASCLAELDPIPAPVTEITPVGNYQPLPYVVPGLLARQGSDPGEADRLARVGSAAICFAFLSLAVFLLSGGGILALVGVVAAVTPMVLFVSASVNPSGLEIAAGIAFAAALLRLTRGPDPPTWVWAAAAVAGAALALSRSPAPLWVVLDALVVLALAGVAPAWRLVRASPVAASLAGATVLAAIALSVLWEREYGSRLSFEGGAFLDRLGAGFARIPIVLREEIGMFGSLDARMPRPAYALWYALVLALLVAALVVGRARERVLLVAVTIATIAVPVLLSAALFAGTGFDVQGRHVLPFAVMLPLASGEILFRNRGALSVDAAPFAVFLFAFAAAVHFGAWYWNARRQSVGVDGPLAFVFDPQWSPPLGWVPWLLAAGAGALLLALAAAPALASRLARGARGLSAT